MNGGETDWNKKQTIDRQLDLDIVCRYEDAARLNAKTRGFDYVVRYILIWDKMINKRKEKLGKNDELNYISGIR